MRRDSPRTVSRRQFTSTAAMAALSAAIVPSRVLGRQAPSNKLNLACIGIGGMGGANLQACADENIVALCDVDTEYAAKNRALYPKANFYGDYRELLEKQVEILEPPRDWSYGHRTLFFRDPEGNILEIYADIGV